jgi:hypothetical protein
MTDPVATPASQVLPTAGDSLATTEAYAAKGATGFRITVPEIEKRIVSTTFLNLGDAVERSGLNGTASEHRTTLCSLTLDNGFVVIGKSAPVDPQNFDAAKGRRFAYEDAFRQLWPLLAYAWLDRYVDHTRPPPELSPPPPGAVD